jgi:sucrose phosphorylase
VPYELNINYLDALAIPGREEPVRLQADRFLTAQAIMLALAGVPAVYFHSLVGSRGWPEGVRKTGHPRTINREKLDRRSLEEELAVAGSLRHEVFRRYTQRLVRRGEWRAFHPAAPQQILDAGEHVLAVMRGGPELESCVLCLHNVTETVEQADVATLTRLSSMPGDWVDLMTGDVIASDRASLRLGPYQTLWIGRETRPRAPDSEKKRTTQRRTLTGNG